MSGVCELHALNIIHMDIKPDNFILVNGTLKVGWLGGELHALNIIHMDIKSDNFILVKGTLKVGWFGRGGAAHL